VLSAGLFDLIACPDCAGAITRAADASIRCTQCARAFVYADGVLDLRPRAVFDEQTKYLDEALHADARHERVAPPVLGSKIRQDMLRKFLQPKPGDRIIDLGCGSGRTLAWNADSGAMLVGIDIAPFFARETRERCDLLLGDLRRLPLRAGGFTKAWSLDVLEHLSPDALADMLAEANRVLADGGALFVYTHVRKNGWPAAGVRLANRVARLAERVGLLDLRLERLRKSDHVNPLADHDELGRVVAAAGFRLERVTYYSPVVGAFVENVFVRMGERWLARHAKRRMGKAAASDEAGVRAARERAQEAVRKGGLQYRLLTGVSQVMKLDLLLFGRIKSGPFFALLRKTGPGRSH
jgi:SAM-dependent methyltransferase